MNITVPPDPDESTMPDPLLAPGASAPTEAPTTASAAPPSAPEPALAPSPAPSSPTTASGAAPHLAPEAVAPAPASDYQGVRDALAGYGVDLRTQFQDDHAALQHLALAYRQAQQSNQLAQYGQQYIQHAGEFQQFLAQRQQAQQAQQTQQAEWFKAPEFDARWQHQITRDPATGELRPVPGAPPDVVQKYTAWQQHQVDFNQRLAQDPIATLKPGLEQVARQMAQEAIQQHMGQYQERTAAQAILQENSSWLHVRDGQGNLQMGANGHPELSALGKHYLGYVQEAERSGIHNSQDVHRYAFRALKGDIAMAQLSQLQGAAQPTPAGTPAAAALPVGEAQKQAFLASAAAGHRPNTGGSVAPVLPNGQHVSQNGTISARERLTQAFQAQGYNLGTPIAGGVGR